MGSIHRGCSSREQLSAQSDLWNHAFSFINSMSLKCAIELGIPDVIHKHGKAITLSNLSAALLIPDSKIPCLRRLMRLLAHSKFFAVEADGDDDELEPAYSLTNFSEVLVTEKNFCLSPFVLLMLDQTFLSPWRSLSTWLKGGRPLTTFETAHGMLIWDATGKLAEFNKMFNEGLSSDASFTADVLIRNCGDVFQGLTSLVDVGGGTGTLARAVAEAFPTMKCTVLELPQVVDGQEGSERLEFVGGDMFERVPPADAALLKWVLHDWSDEECVKILGRCKEAIPSREAGGKVIIVEMVVSTNKLDHESAKTQFLLDLHIMVHTTGKQRSEAEWKKIFVDAGFKGYKILPVLGLRSVIEVYY